MTASLPLSLSRRCRSQRERGLGTTRDHSVKKLLSLALPLSAMLAAPAYSQIWIEDHSATNLTFVMRAANNTATPAGANAVTLNEYDSKAGVRVEFKFLANLTLSVKLTNLSATYNSSSVNTVNRTVTPDGGSAQTVQFKEGYLTDFGFAVNPSSFSFGSMTLKSTNDSSITFASQAPIFVHIVDYSIDVGARSTSVTRGLDAGKFAEYEFKFNNSNAANASMFNTYQFFGRNGDYTDGGSSSPASDIDFMSVFQYTNNESHSGYNSKGKKVYTSWDKVAVNLDVFPEADPPELPEPSTYGLIGAAGLLGLIALRRRAARRHAA